MLFNPVVSQSLATSCGIFDVMKDESDTDFLFLESRSNSSKS